MAAIELSWIARIFGWILGPILRFFDRPKLFAYLDKPVLKDINPIFPNAIDEVTWRGELAIKNNSNIDAFDLAVAYPLGLVFDTIEKLPQHNNLSPKSEIRLKFTWVRQYPHDTIGLRIRRGQIDTTLPADKFHFTFVLQYSNEKGRHFYSLIEMLNKEMSTKLYVFKPAILKTSIVATSQGDKDRRILKILEYLNQGQIRANNNLSEASLRSQFDFTNQDFDEAFNEVQNGGLVYLRSGTAFLAISRDGEIKYNELHKRFNITSKKRLLKFLAWSLPVLISASALLFGDNVVGRFRDFISSHPQVESNNITPEKPRLDTAQHIKLSNLDTAPIIDKGIFIKYYFNNFVIGGANIDTVRIGARTKLGESLHIERKGDELIMDITSEPYMEFEYKGIYYSLEVLGRHYAFNVILRKNIQLTLVLKKY